LTLQLESAVTEPLLTRVPTSCDVRPHEALLAALTLAAVRWRQHGDALLIDVEGHGREDLGRGLDVLHTVGWFTTLYPVRLQVSRGALERGHRGRAGLRSALDDLKAQLRRIPSRGVGYGLLRYLNASTSDSLRHGARAHILFNYLGRTGPRSSGAWRRAPEASVLGGFMDESMPMSHALSLNVVARDDASGPQLMASWSWSPAVLTEADVRRLAEGWFDVLRDVAALAQMLPQPE